MSSQTVKVINLTELAAYKDGKFVTSTTVTLHAPKRELIKAAALLGELPPGVEVIERKSRKLKSDEPAAAPVELPTFIKKQ